MERTAPIRFTPATVREVAERAKRITGGRFQLGTIGTHADGGPKYTDANEDVAWYGPVGARQACAYYSGAALRMARLEGQVVESDDHDFLLGVQIAYRRGGASSQAERQSFDGWEARGAERAEKLFREAE